MFLMQSWSDMIWWWLADLAIDVLSCDLTLFRCHDSKIGTQLLPVPYDLLQSLAKGVGPSWRCISWCMWIFCLWTNHLFPTRQLSHFQLCKMLVCRLRGGKVATRTHCIFSHNYSYNFFPTIYCNRHGSELLLDSKSISCVENDCGLSTHPSDMRTCRSLLWHYGPYPLRLRGLT